MLPFKFCKITQSGVRRKIQCVSQSEPRVAIFVNKLAQTQKLNRTLRICFLQVLSNLLFLERSLKCEKFKTDKECVHTIAHFILQLLYSTHMHVLKCLKSTMYFEDFLQKQTQLAHLRHVSTVYSVHYSLIVLLINFFLFDPCKCSYKDNKFKVVISILVLELAFTNQIILGSLYVCLHTRWGKYLAHKSSKSSQRLRR